MIAVRIILLTGVLLLVLSNAKSQTPPGVAEFNEVQSDMERIYIALSRLSFAIGAVTGLLGGFRIYNNWQMGKHHVDIQVIGWFGACLFLSIIGFFLSGLYGVPIH
jgi:cytochrome bd-type quinol oxidase subunit 1